MKNMIMVYIYLEVIEMNNWFNDPLNFPVLCWVNNDNFSDKLLRVINRYNSKTEMFTSHGDSYTKATPVLKSEIDYLILRQALEDMNNE